MTVYEKFCKLMLNLSAVGLEPGDTKSDYFCTPKGAKVIGWAGVDGIHYCFVKGFGEMVFAVNPMELPGNYVHPLAKSFEDFLRLLLACGDLAAAEQCHGWNRTNFEAFLKENPVTKEQKALLDFVKEKLSLTPMEDPFEYLKALQESFDYGSIPYKKEYYEGIPMEPEAPEKRTPREWKVYFDGGFYQRRRKGRAGQELSVGKKFNWNGNDWYIPSVYVCAKGLVVDFCIAVDAEAITAYYEKWGFAEGRPDSFNEEERELAMRENPLDIHFNVKAEVNKKSLREWHGSGMCWIPEKCFFEGMENTEEAMEIVEHYSLDKEMGWVFHRVAFPWVTKTKPAIKTLSLELKPHLISIDGLTFATPNIGESISFLHPVSGETHTLTALSFEKETLSTKHFPEKDYEFPSCFSKMTYTLSPDIPDVEFLVKDVCPNDTPRRISALDGLGAVSIGIIGGADGPTAVFLVTKGEETCYHAACSALRFEPVEEVKWRMVFRRKPCEDIRVALLSGES